MDYNNIAVTVTYTLLVYHIRQEHKNQNLKIFKLFVCFCKPFDIIIQK